MNKKETLEIRKQFTPANCAITRICGCYVDHEKNKVFEMKDAFLSLPEEEEHKYFDIFLRETQMIYDSIKSKTQIKQCVKLVNIFVNYQGAKGRKLQNICICISIVRFGF